MAAKVMIPPADEQGMWAHQLDEDSINNRYTFRR